MGTRNFNGKESEAQALQVAEVNSQAGATRTRYQAVRLYGLGDAVTEIVQICGCSQRSLAQWCHRYRAEGVSGLLDHRAGGNRAQLLALAIEELSQLLHCYTPGQRLGPEKSGGDGQHWTIADLQQVVAQRYRVRYQSLTSYRTLFARGAFSDPRATKQSKSRNEVKVMDVEEQLEKNS
jgi:transposase